MRVWEQTRGEKPSTKDTQVFKEAMIAAVRAANHEDYKSQKANIPEGFKFKKILLAHPFTAFRTSEEVMHNYG